MAVRRSRASHARLVSFALPLFALVGLPGLVACSDPPPSGSDSGTPDPDSGVDTGMNGPPCTLDVTGTPSATMRITHLGLPSGAGFNLDGINNSAATGGATVAGCGRSDSTGGVDNALGSIATTLAGLIDLSTALQDTLVHTVPDGATEGSIEVDVELFGLDAGTSDSCFSTRVTVHSTGNPDIVVTGTGANLNNVAQVRFTNVLTFNIALEVPPESCNNQQCTPGAMLAIDVRGGRAQLNLNAAHTALGAGSLIGGYVFFEDCTGGTIDANGVCQGGTYAAVNPTGFKQALTAFADAVNLDDTFQTMAIEAFRGARDLHMEPDGSLSPCTGANNTSVNKNTVSVALAIDSI